jgi:predicted nucleotidyltransferase
MERLVVDHQGKIAALCRKFKVRRLELFGSAATGDFDPESSDLDFLVEFGDLRQDEWADAYFGLNESLEALLGRHVDLVMPTAVTNPYLRQSIAASKTVVYAV